MSKFIEKKLNNLRENLTDNDKRIKEQFKIVYAAFAIVSFLMSILNFLSNSDNTGILLYQTIAYCALNVINYVLAISSEKVEKFVRGLFAVESGALFTSFLIIGQPEGFSIIWCALVPCATMLLYGKKWGSIISTVMLIVLTVFLWIPPCFNLLPDVYTASFRWRFPLLYIAFFAFALIFELIREYTQNQLDESRDRYKRLSYTDRLTDIGSSAAYFEYIDQINADIVAGKEIKPFGVVSLDLNLLKETNDTYGHEHGNALILETAQVMKKTFKTSKWYRVGGDEFTIIVEGEDYKNIDSTVKWFSGQYSYKHIISKNMKIVFSIACGYSVYKKGDRFNTVYQRADKEMYKNKEEIKEKYNLNYKRK